ncbi:GNAT family N-acetyltransferase [uncultured Bifidobacterium sp.]|uniref:GNAT family N-acetyltransferase n=1 Tax=uncultured Bifidobacterium sp. TaxID=165187 RepID=UPI002636AC00|nr:GNAT family N-acetyltransferase [uncultured Bifidobacterium sp.]
MVILQTERLILRPWRVDDARDARFLYRYASDPDVGPHAGWPAHTSVEESADVIRDVLSDEQNFAITFRGAWEGKSPDAPIGSIGLKIVPDDPGSREIGYWIGRPFWGRGLTPEAAGELIRYGFEELGLDAVYGMHDVSNLQSSRVMEKLGLTELRVMREVPRPLLGDGFRRDEVLRRLTRSQWHKRRFDQ